MRGATRRIDLGCLRLLARRDLLGRGAGAPCAEHRPAKRCSTRSSTPAFDYFWNEANPANGLIKDRSTPGSPCQHRRRRLRLLRDLHRHRSRLGDARRRARARAHHAEDLLERARRAPAANGIDRVPGALLPLSRHEHGTRTWNSRALHDRHRAAPRRHSRREAVLRRRDPLDVQMRTLADTIYAARQLGVHAELGLGIRMGWKPEGGFSGFGTWVGYNEAMILYILALGSPTHPVPAKPWFTWTSGYDWRPSTARPTSSSRRCSATSTRTAGSTSGTSRTSTCGARGSPTSRTRGAPPWRSARTASPTRAGSSGYGERLWGLTASRRSRDGYTAHGAPPAQNDNGTITPTAPAARCRSRPRS